MGMLLAGVGALSTFYPDAKQIDDPEERYMAAVRLIAKVPTLAAFSYRHNMGLPYVYPDNDLNFAENFLSMMFKKTEDRAHPEAGALEGPRRPLHPPRRPRTELLDQRRARRRLLRRRPLLGGGGRVSPRSTGRSHGGANEAVLRMLRRIEKPENIPDFLARVKDREEKLMGFGHRVYKNYDPRARIIQQHMDEVFEATEYNPLVEIARELEKQALDDEYFTSRKLYPNVDFYSGIIYEALGIPTNMFTVLFAIPRTAGWVAQWMEMHEDPETKIARPRQIYTGARERDYVAIDDRDGPGEDRRPAGPPAETAAARRLTRRAFPQRGSFVTNLVTKEPRQTLDWPMARSEWKLTVRHGSEVAARASTTLDEAVAAMRERALDDPRRGAGRRPSRSLREFEPGGPGSRARCS